VSILRAISSITDLISVAIGASVSILIRIFVSELNKGFQMLDGIGLASLPGGTVSYKFLDCFNLSA
jgi:hypothetical protein